MPTVPSAKQTWKAKEINEWINIKFSLYFKLDKTSQATMRESEDLHNRV